MASALELMLREVLREYLPDAAVLTEAAKAASERLDTEDFIRTPDERRMWRAPNFLDPLPAEGVFGKKLEVDGIVSRTRY